MNTPSEAQSSLKNMPISFFSVVMGLAGTTIAWEKAQQVSGVQLGYLSEILLSIAGLVFVILLCTRQFRNPRLKSHSHSLIQ